MTQYNPFLSPYMANQYQQPYQVPQMQSQTQVVRVNGENGARAYNLGPNSSALLLDESGTMIWLCTTDGAGYKSVSAYDITPHQAQPPIDYDTIEQRIKRLEEFVNEFTSDPAGAAGKK